MRGSVVWLTVLAVASATVLGALFVSGHLDDPGWVHVSNLGSLDRAKVLYLPSEKVFLVANGSRPLALSAVSPHVGEPIFYCRSSGYFEDFVGGDKFNGLGDYALGPSPRGMDRVRLMVEGDEVLIQPNAIWNGPPRGTGKAMPPAGPFCTAGRNLIQSSPGFVRPPSS